MGQWVGLRTSPAETPLEYAEVVGQAVQITGLELPPAVSALLAEHAGALHLVASGYLGESALRERLSALPAQDG